MDNVNHSKTRFSYHHKFFQGFRIDLRGLRKGRLSQYFEQRVCWAYPSTDNSNLNYQHHHKPNDYYKKARKKKGRTEETKYLCCCLVVCSSTNAYAASSSIFLHSYGWSYFYYRLFNDVIYIIYNIIYMIIHWLIYLYIIDIFLYLTIYLLLFLW